MQKPKKFTLKKLAINFGERIGEDVYPRQIKVSGNWLFYKPDQHSQFGYTKDAYPIECYWAKGCEFSGVMTNEPWDGKVKSNDHMD